MYKGATAINDQTGVININVDTGQAFYNDGTGIILNYGEINLNGAKLIAPTLIMVLLQRIWNCYLN